MIAITTGSANSAMDPVLMRKAALLNYVGAGYIYARIDNFRDKLSRNVTVEHFFLVSEPCKNARIQQKIV